MVGHRSGIKWLVQLFSHWFFAAFEIVLRKFKPCGGGIMVRWHCRVLLVWAVVLLAGCLTMSGNYVVTAVDGQGSPLNVVSHAQGSGIYSVRNAICAAQPKAVVTIRERESGKEVAGESPYRCN